MTDILELLDLHADSCEALSGEDMPEGTYETRAWQLQSAIAMAKAARQMRAAIESIANLRRENCDLRKIVSESASAIGNGACVAPQCSIEFMQGVPREIAGCTERLRQELAEARERNLLANERADNAVADLEKALEEISAMKSERLYIVGANDGWEEAVEQIAEGVESGNIATRYQAPESIAAAIRALAAGKEG